MTELPLDAKGVRGGGGESKHRRLPCLRWSDANLNYVAVSDMDEKALGEFVEVFRRGGGAATEPAKPVTRGLADAIVTAPRALRVVDQGCLRLVAELLPMRGGRDFKTGNFRRIRN